MCCHKKVEKKHVWPSISLYHKGRGRRKAKMMMEGWAGVRLQNAMFRAKRKGGGCNLREVLGKLKGGWPQVWPRIAYINIYIWFPVSWLIDRLLNRSLPRESFYKEDTVIIFQQIWILLQSQFEMSLTGLVWFQLVVLFWNAMGTLGSGAQMKK